MVLAHILITLYVMVAPNVYAVDKRIRIPIASIEACRAWIEDEAKVVIEYAGHDMRTRHITDYSANAATDHARTWEQPHNGPAVEGVPDCRGSIVGSHAANLTRSWFGQGRVGVPPSTWPAYFSAAPVYAYRHA